MPIKWRTERSPAAQSLPKNYRLICEIVEKSGAGCHLTPSQIYAKALRRRPGIGFSTVYRGLERLRDLGMVSEVYVSGRRRGNLRALRAAPRPLPVQRMRHDRGRRLLDSGTHRQGARLATWFQN